MVLRCTCWRRDGRGADSGTRSAGSGPIAGRTADGRALAPLAASPKLRRAGKRAFGPFAISGPQNSHMPARWKHAKARGGDVGGTNPARRAGIRSF